MAGFVQRTVCLFLLRTVCLFLLRTVCLFLLPIIGRPGGFSILSQLFSLAILVPIQMRVHPWDAVNAPLQNRSIQFLGPKDGLDLLLFLELIFLVLSFASLDLLVTADSLRRHC